MEYIIVTNEGSRFYYKEREMKTLHRIGKPAVEYSSGAETWVVNGHLHRVDGPAIKRADGTLCWYKRDVRHREDGPAVEYPDGTKEWWLHGRQLSERDYQLETAGEIVLTMEEIAERFGVDVSMIKIKK